MATPVKLKVGNKEVKSTEVTYDDLVILYQQYIDTYSEVPVYSKCDSKHNMPQGRIITRVLKENNVTYNDFLLQFGKVSHVRTESKDYQLYVDKYIKYSKEKGSYVQDCELMNNTLGLPSSGWFVKYCPDENVKTFTDFVQWCGFETIHRLTKEEVSEKLLELQNKLNRPIINDDVTPENVGFSMIVVNRLFGTLGKAKEEIGLLQTPTSIPLRPFEYYKNTLTEALDNLHKQTGRKFLTWNDLESGLYHKNNIEHKTITKAFKRENLDVFAYIKSLGFEMNPNSFSFKYTFNDGERAVSTMEYDFSTYLRSLGFEYNQTYYRDIMYKTFTNLEKSRKTNCDYCLYLNNGEKLYIEIAGVIQNDKNNSWRTIDYKYKRHTDYQQKMLFKEKLLIENNCNYLFLFPCEMKTGKYKEILQNKINEIIEEVA